MLHPGLRKALGAEICLAHISVTQKKKHVFLLLAHIQAALKSETGLEGASG